MVTYLFYDQKSYHKKIMLYFKSLLLNEWPTFRILPLFVSYLTCFEVTENTYIIRKLCDDFFDFTPTELNTLAENGPYRLYSRTYKQ